HHKACQLYSVRYWRTKTYSRNNESALFSRNFKTITISTRTIISPSISAARKSSLAGTANSTKTFYST
ncbi:hypothetical protein MTO96_044489, partial [Rhipicephalus appendiculatus]